jgi:ABC-type taurine transport system ATPase subunit
LLQRVGLTEHAAKYPGQLSGGQQQRVGYAPIRACADVPLQEIIPLMNPVMAFFRPSKVQHGTCTWMYISGVGMHLFRHSCRGMPFVAHAARPFLVADRLRPLAEVVP